MDKFLQAISGISSILNNRQLLLPFQAHALHQTKRPVTAATIPESNDVSGVGEQNQLADATAMLTETVYTTLDGDATETAETFKLLARLAEENRLNSSSIYPC